MSGSSSYHQHQHHLHYYYIIITIIIIIVVIILSSIQSIDSFRERAKKSAIDVMNIHVLTPNPAYSRADGVNISKEAHAVTTKTLVVLETKLNKVSYAIVIHE
jgi:hypothetical protein